MSQHQQNPSTRKNSAKIDQSLKKTDPKKFIKANLFIKDKVIKKQMQKNFETREKCALSTIKKNNFKIRLFL